MERLDDILNRSALRRPSHYGQRTQTQKPAQEEQPSRQQPARRTQAEPRTNPLRNSYASQQSYAARTQGPRRSSPPARPEPTPPPSQPARRYGAGAQHSPLSPQRLADYGASTYRRHEQEEAQTPHNNTPQTYAVPSHTIYYHTDDAIPAIESDVLPEDDILTEADLHADAVQPEDLFVEEDEGEQAQPIYYDADTWEDEYEARKQYSQKGTHIIADALPGYETPDYKTLPPYDVSDARAGFSSQRGYNSRNLRNVRPVLGSIKPPAALPAPRRPGADLEKPSAALPEPHTHLSVPRSPAALPEPHMHLSASKASATFSESHTYEARQPGNMQRARTTQPLYPQQDGSPTRIRELSRNHPTQERAHRSSVARQPVHIQPRLPETDDTFVMPAPKPPCKKCRGAGYLRANVPYGHPNFGKPIACECKEAERKAKRREQLREMSNLDAFQDSTFPTFNWRQSGVKEAFEACYRYAQSPDGWLVLIGPNGCGKTHLAAAIANQCLESGSVVLFAVVPDLLDHLRAAFAPTATELYDQLFAKMREAEVLVLDDLGAQQSSPWANEKLFQLLNYRYNMGMPTVITANPKGMQGIDERIRSRMGDIALAETIQFTHAQDYRPHHGRRS